MTQTEMDYLVRSDITLLGCTTDEELFNGVSIYRAFKPTPAKPIKEGCDTPSFPQPAFCEDHVLNFSGRQMVF